MRVILIGKASGRLDCMAEALANSRRTELFILTNLDNMSLRDKGLVTTGPIEDPNFVIDYVGMIRTASVLTIAVISNEEILAAGVVDRLNEINIPVVGPTKAAAQIETSKIFMRKLLAKHRPTYSPAWAAFNTENHSHIDRFIGTLNTLGLQVVVKPDGLTGGKGVRLQGDHLYSRADVIDYCNEILASDHRVMLEARIDGQEFSRMAFSDGHHVIPMPAVQDHKRLGEGDHGVNTGGMGSYSNGDHSLPFLTADDLRAADALNEYVVRAIAEETGNPYKGILYGNFITDADGIKLIEYNARFGDPEAMNVLPLLDTNWADFGDICNAIVTGSLIKKPIRFAHKATVCKYLLPIGYPYDPTPGRIDISAVERQPDLRIYMGAVDGDWLTGSRALAVVGIADDLRAAEAIAERAAQQVCGPLYHRRDIGTPELIDSKIEHMRRLRSTDDADSQYRDEKRCDES